jgi:hypothetical protein
MPQGYYTIEQWTRRKKRVAGEWVSVGYLPFGLSLTEAEGALERIGKPGFYRLVQLQRVIWAEKKDGKFHLRKSHAGSPSDLGKMTEMFDRTGGKFPEDEVREARKLAKKERGS